MSTKTLIIIMGRKPIIKTMKTIKTVLSNFTSSSLKTVPTGCTNHFRNKTESIQKITNL